MDDEKAFSAYLSDKMSQCKSKSMITYTSFLDLYQQNTFLSLPKDNEITSFLFSGNENCERKIGVFSPTSFEIKTPEDFLSFDEGKPLCVIRVEKDKFSSLTHRDYLGALMALGIKREKIGDIVVFEKGSYIIVFEEIADYIKDNLWKIGRGSCKVTYSSFGEIPVCRAECKEMFMTVASLRLDNVVSACFGISRKSAVSEILSKKVFVNDVLWEKSDKTVPIGAKIVLRGKGKALLAEENGKSKKDKSKIIIKRY